MKYFSRQKTSGSFFNSIFYTDVYAQEMMRKIVAEKAKYQESPEFLRQMRENPSLLAELVFL